jgi:hypothetical protein
MDEDHCLSRKYCILTNSNDPACCTVRLYPLQSVIIAMNRASLAISVLTVALASICATLMICLADYSLLIAVFNLVTIILCYGICWLKGFHADSQVMVRLDALYRGAMNGVIFGVIICFIVGIGVDKYIPISFGISLGTFIGMLLAILFPNVMSKIPSL